MFPVTPDITRQSRAPQGPSLAPGIFKPLGSRSIVPSPGRRQCLPRTTPCWGRAWLDQESWALKPVFVAPNCCVCALLRSALGVGSPEGAILWAVLLSFLPSYAREMQRAAEYHWPPQTVSLRTWSPKVWGAGASGLEICPPQWDPPSPAQVPPLPAPPPPHPTP